MSNEYKLVPVKPTEEMLTILIEKWFSDTSDDDRESMVSAYNAAIAASPPPPALGGEPEETAWIITDEDGTIDATVRWDVAKHSFGEATPMISKAVHRAHLALLQAEIERIHQQFDELAAAVGFTKDRCEQTGDSPLDCAMQLQAEITGSKKERSFFVARNDELHTRNAELEGLLLLIRDQPSLNPVHRARIKSALSKPAGSEQS